MTEDVIRSLIVLLANAPELQGFAVRSFYAAFKSWQGQVSVGFFHPPSCHCSAFLLVLRFATRMRKVRLVTTPAQHLQG